jgi:hypothetical protein
VYLSLDIWHDGRMRTRRRLRTLSNVPAFRPTPTIQGVFSNPKVRVIQQCSYAGCGLETSVGTVRSSRRSCRIFMPRRSCAWPLEAWRGEDQLDAVGSSSLYGL